MGIAKKIAKQLRYTIVIIAVWILFASPFLLFGKIPFPSTYLVSFFPPWSAYHGMPVKNGAMPDLITQIFPWKKLTIETWRDGSIPLWNPYSFSGTHHAANYQTAVFSPVNILYLLMSMVQAWSIQILLQPLLAGLFMYLFLRRLGRSPPARLIGSISFMFCGFMTTWMAYGTLGFAALWIPLALYGVHRLMYEDTWIPGLLLSASISMSFLSGHFQISLYVLLAVVSYIGYLGFLHGRWRKSIYAIGFVVSGLFTAAPQLLLSFDAFSESVRSTIIQPSSINPKYLPTFFAPDFYGNPVTRNDWFGQYAEWASYVGVVPLLLGMYSVTMRRKEVMYFALLALIGIFLAYPTPLNSIIFSMKIPVISTSNATRIIVLVSFSLAVMSAYGFDFLRLDWTKKDIRRMYIFMAVVCLMVVTIWSIAVFAPFIPDEHISVARRNLILPTGTAVVFLFLVFIRQRLKGGIMLGAFSSIIVLLVCFDMFRYSSKWMPFDPEELVYPPLPVVSYLQEHGGNWRVYGNVGNELFTGQRIQSIEGYDALYQYRYAEFIGSSHDGHPGIPQPAVVTVDKHGEFVQEVFNLLGVRYVLHRASDGRNVWAFPHWEYDHYRSVYKDEQYEILENTHVLPRAFLASSYQIVTEKNDILQTLYDKSFDMKDRLILEKSPSIEPEAGEGEVSIRSYKPNDISIEIQSSSPKLLFLSDVYNDGWDAFIDGEQVEVLRANYDFRAVAVPSGSHQVQFVYNPGSVGLGMKIAVLNMLLLVFGTIYNVYAHRNLRSISRHARRR